MLVAAFSAVVAIGALSGLAGAKSDGQGDSTWGASVVATTDQSDGALGPVSPDVADDSTWG
ncbi:hypothetical protein [Streptomyces sp. NPDC050535]|uniref:hypothetical protein n=1 Tax=Streptomyces sp. NPDC050535 TaxID=3365626 RepID=UPI00378EDB24